MDETTAPTTPGPVTDAPPYYCPGCGTRYFGPGTCSNQHPPIELKRDPAVALPTDSVAAPATGDEPPPGPGAAAQDAPSGTAQNVAAVTPPSDPPVAAATTDLATLASEARQVLQAAREAVERLERALSHQ